MPVNKRIDLFHNSKFKIHSRKVLLDPQAEVVQTVPVEAVGVLFNSLVMEEGPQAPPLFEVIATGVHFAPSQ